MILLSYTVDEKSFSTIANNLSPMQFPVSILSITLFFVSVGFFVAQENSFSLFLKIVSSIGILLFMLFGFYSFFFIMAGLASLKSG